MVSSAEQTLHAGLLAKLIQSCLMTLHDPMDCSPPGSSVHGILQARIHTGLGCPALLQGSFLTQGLNPGLLHCRLILYHPSHQGSPRLFIPLLQLSAPFLLCPAVDVRLAGVALGGLRAAF